MGQTLGFAVANPPWTNLEPSGIVSGWGLALGLAVMATLRPSQYYFGHIPFFVHYYVWHESSLDFQPARKLDKTNSYFFC